MNANVNGLALDATDLFNLLMNFPSYPDTTVLASQTNLFPTDLYRQYAAEVVNPSDLTPLMASEPLSSTVPNSPELPHGASASAQLSPMATSFNIPATPSPNSLFYPALSPSLPSGLSTDASSPTMAMNVDMFPGAFGFHSTPAPAKIEAVAIPQPAAPTAVAQPSKGKSSAKMTSSPDSSPDTDNPSLIERKSIKRTAADAVDDMEEEVDLKKLSSKERRQIRNKISARNFRLRRKEYIATLEGQVKELQDEACALEASLDQCQSQNADLKAVLAKVRSAIDSQLAEELGLNDPVLLAEPAFVTSANRKDTKSMPKAASSVNNGKSAAHTAKKIKLPSSPAGMATTVMSLFNLSSVLSADKQRHPASVGLKLPLFSLPRHAETRPSRRRHSSTTLPAGQPLADAVVNPMQLIDSPMEEGSLFADDESMGDGYSTPPTPFASPVLSAAISSPETLVGDDEFMGDVACLQSLTPTPFFSTLTANTPAAHSPTLQAKQLPHTQEDLLALEHALEDEFHRTLSLSLSQLANNA
ncbi:hypothetical protein H4R34_004036 [Dimargaris verticillata]|uniref:BZIP domain-containing protein n=1 Tax=Dimargaris verticillata TaxID=2761393 RepID=A0A9W8AZL6_9FUNG|nr:hypothetical protein H4R34_004036 [Dimargaris verticillata]